MERFFCAMNALSPAERQEHAALHRGLRAAVRARRTLRDGYAFELNASVLGWEALTRWVALERRCCPFFRFCLELGPGEALVLNLTGAPGVKQFIEAEIGSAPRRIPGGRRRSRVARRDLGSGST